MESDSRSTLSSVTLRLSSPELDNGDDSSADDESSPSDTDEEDLGLNYLWHNLPSHSFQK